MLRRGDEHTLLLQAGGVTDAGHIAADSLDFEAIQIHAPENDPCTSRRRQDAKSDRSSAVQANSLTLDGRPNCLFKWQVVLDKQITPLHRSLDVAFLPQSVARKVLNRWNRLFFARI